MDEKRKELNREELYERVWSTPMVHLAKEFGISDVGLAKICKRNAIPRPPVGYWSKIAAGHRVKKKQLPPLRSEDDAKIVIQSQGTLVLKKDTLPEEFQTAVLEAKEKVAALDPEGVSARPHPLIKWAEKAFGDTSTSYTGTLEPREHGCLNIRVTEHSLNRALDFLDALFKLVELCGYELAVMENRHVALDILEERLELRLKERIKRTETRKANNPALHSQSMLSYVNPDSRGAYSHREYLYEPTGELCLVVKNPEFYVYERQWCDTNNSTIEERLGSIIIKLIEFAGQSHLKRLEREEYHRQYEIKEANRIEQNRLWQEKQKLLEEERIRVESLTADAEKWWKSNVLRSYIEARKAQALANNETYAPTSDLGRWINWAEEQTDRLDPLVASPPSLHDPDK